MNPPYDAITIAKYLIKKAKEDKVKDLTNLKLQKILYYAQGWYLANNNKKLFSDQICAWKLGPVVRSVYDLFSNNGNRPIDMNVNANDVSELDQNTKKFLDTLWKVYKNMNGAELVTYTHQEKPWKEAWSKRNDKDSEDDVISADSIKEYFESKLKNG